MKHTEQFVLVRKNMRYFQNGERMKINVRPETYKTLADWAVETGLPIVELCARAVEYANEHLAYIEEG